MKNLNDYSWCPNQDSNQATAEYKSEVLLPEPSYRGSICKFHV
jgi:hypothetical protein